MKQIDNNMEKTTLQYKHGVWKVKEERIAGYVCTTYSCTLGKFQAKLINALLLLNRGL